MLSSSIVSIPRTKHLKFPFLCDPEKWVCLQIHTILDEIIFGGQVLETSSTEVLKAIEEISKCSLSPLVFNMVLLFCIIMVNKKALHSGKLVTRDFSLSIKAQPFFYADGMIWWIKIIFYIYILWRIGSNQNCVFFKFNAGLKQHPIPWILFQNLFQIGGPGSLISCGRICSPTCEGFEMWNEASLMRELGSQLDAFFFWCRCFLLKHWSNEWHPE